MDRTSSARSTGARHPMIALMEDLKRYRIIFDATGCFA